MTSTPTLLILDDDPSRHDRMHAAVNWPSAPPIRCFTRGDAFLHVCRTSPIAALSLDHDLALDDPANGLSIVRELIATIPAPPLTIVHTSNADQSTRMIGELELARWPHVRIPAIGEDWIEADWAPTLRRQLDS